MYDNNVVKRKKSVHFGNSLFDKLAEKQEKN